MPQRRRVAPPPGFGSQQRDVGPGVRIYTGPGTVHQRTGFGRIHRYGDHPRSSCRLRRRTDAENTWVSLGGWGGYIVVGFDHSIDNSSSGYKGGYNFSITGNAFKGSSEPGIVYVMQDTNGNTLPDDDGTNSKDRSSARRRPFRITRSPITGRPTREPTYNGRTTRASRARSTT